jgi:hypothetical protein
MGTFLIFLILSLTQGIVLLAFGFKGALFGLVLLYLCVLIRFPHIALIIGLTAILDGAGLINSETFFRFPGIAKAKDIIFVSLFLPLLLMPKWYKRGYTILKGSPQVLLPVFVLLMLATCQMFRTALQYDLPLNSCVMAGRHYWYYSLVPLTAIYLDTAQHRKAFFTLFLLITGALSLVVIAQTVLYAWLGIRFVASNIVLLPSDWGGSQFFSRIYIPGEPMIVLLLSISFWGMFCSGSRRDRSAFFLLCLLSALAILSLNSRGRWFHSVLVLAIPLVVPAFRLKRPVRFKVLIWGLTVVLTISLVLIFLSSMDTRVSAFGARVASSWTDVRDRSGTWGYRIEDNQVRLGLISKHLLFGVGFVHDDFARRFGTSGASQDVMKLPNQGVSTTDSGIIALAVDFGLMGFAWAIWYIVTVALFGFSLIRIGEPYGISWLAISLNSYMLGGMIVLVTLCLFSQMGDIIGHSIVLGLLLSSTTSRNHSVTDS